MIRWVDDILPKIMYALGANNGMHFHNKGKRRNKIDIKEKN